MRVPSRPLDPAQAIAVHLDWKLVLSHPCAAGWPPAWIPPACLGGTAELRQEHRQFQAAAGQILRRLQDGETAAGLLGPFEDGSAELVNRLGAFALAEASATPAAT